MPQSGVHNDILTYMFPCLAFQGRFGLPSPQNFLKTTLDWARLHASGAAGELERLLDSFFLITKSACREEVLLEVSRTL